MGRVIATRYQIQRELGAGGMGTVFLGLDTRTQQSVAIKQLKKEIAHPDMLERFQREGQALRELNHPNIVKLLDALQHEDEHFLIMEYVSGGDLRQLLHQGKLPYQRCLNIAIDLADALTRAHRLNIIHRDLKPANVLLAENGSIRLTDFGVAHVIDKERITQANAFVGTIDYIPPEVLQGAKPEPRSDIWAFGVMLFEMLAGRRPFVGSGYLQILQAIATAPLPDLEALAPDAPTALVDLVYRCLSRDPQARISSVRHIGAELEDILQDRAQVTKAARFVAPTPFNPPKHNFPVQVGDFVGREEEIQQIAQFFAEPKLRLLTIVGQGGIGKTRLMLEVAWRFMSEDNDLLPESPPFYQDGAYFVELAPLSSADEVVAAIAEAVAYSFENDGRSAKQQILDYLRHKHLGLLLDNFEHIMDVSSLVAEILHTAPYVRIAVSSRERLNIAGEQVFQLKGIDFPSSSSSANLLQYPAVKLFVQAARRLNPAYELQDDDLRTIATICRLAEGLPLALILAASWLEMLSVQEVLAEMQKNIDFLRSESRDTPERHRSIRAVFEYSWNLLNDAEQSVFAKLAVFRGGFSREAAEAVAGANLRILMNLVNKSLLYRNNSTGRYEIHELLRQYAEERADTKASQQALCRYFVNWFKQHAAQANEDTAVKLYQHIEADFENIRQAWLYATERGAAEDLAEMRQLLYNYWYNRGAWLLGLQLFRATWQKRPELGENSHSLFYAQLGENIGFVLFMMGNYDESKSYLLEGLEWANIARDYSLMAIICRRQGSSLRYQFEFVKAQGWYELSLDYSLKANTPIDQYMVLIGMGNLARQKKDFQGAHSYYDEAEAVSLQDRFGSNLLESSRGILAYVEADYEAANRWHQRVLERDRKWADSWGMANDLAYLTVIAIARNELIEARNYLSEALVLALEIHSATLVLKLLSGAAHYYEACGNQAAAVNLSRYIMSHPVYQSEVAELIEGLAEKFEGLKHVKLEDSLNDLAAKILHDLRNTETEIKDN